MRLVWGTVQAIDREHPDVQRLTVRADGADADAKAIGYPLLTGTCAKGDRVLLNTTAVELALGTGGAHFVLARVAEGGEARGVAYEDASGGHIMKLRYTPLQRDVLSAEEPASEHHEVMAAAESLGGMPVVCCGLHSQLPLVAAALKRVRPGARVAYVMDDDASLPAALSDLVRACRDVSLLDTVVTSGHSFGGDIETVTLHSGLLAARHVARADVAVVAIGPGVVGTASAFGHGGVAQGEAVNAVASLDGRPVAVLRLSFADARPRHRGVSHHSLTALSRIALAPALVAVPELPADQQSVIDEALEGAGVWSRHDRALVSVELPDLRGVSARTMGRGPEDDPAFFLAAAAAGAAAAELLADGTL